MKKTRADNGLEPVPWGDEPWLPQTLIQPTDAAAAREQAATLAETTAAAKTEPKTDEKPADRAMWDRFGRALTALESEIAA